MDKTPVILLTGFLGSGKTTLLNRILTAHHGYRIAVIVNEFGEVGIDHELIVASDREVFQMNNGCMCCTVHGDLLRAFFQLLEERQRFDYIVLETSGLADPTAVIQSLMIDDRIRAALALTNVVTVVDSFHIQQQLAQQAEAARQVACADTILLNKIDLVADDQVARLADELGALNPAARITPTRNAETDIGALLHTQAFDVERKLSLGGDHADHMHNPAVATVSMVERGELSKARLSQWFRRLLAEHGPNIMRMKGILNMAGDSHQFVFHGVHGLFEGRLGREWAEDEEKVNRLVFIGQDLDQAQLRHGLQSCILSGDEPDAAGNIDIYREVSPFTLEQIRVWVRQALEFPRDSRITIKEVPCVKPDCPPIETAIMVFLEAEPPRFYKIQKTINQVTFDSVFDLIENPMPCC